jgi:hypothetical protein
MSVIVDDKEVVESGSVVFEDGWVKVSVQDIIVEFSFETNFESEEQKVIGKNVGDKELQLTLVNFNNPLGTAFSNQIGDIENKPLYLAFYIFALGEERKFRLLHYTFSLGAKR